MAKSATVKKTFLYPDIKNQEFQALVAKLGRSPTQVARASRIKGFLDGVDTIWTKIFEEFKTDLLEKYGTKGEDGKLVTKVGDYSDVEIPEDKIPQYQKDYEEFQKRSCELECLPLTSDTLADIKLSGRELQMLGELYTQEAGPGVPSLGVVNR